MENKWQHLKNPPVVTAIFQLKFDTGSVKLDDFLKYDQILRRDFPGRNDNIESSLQLPPSTRITLGKGQISGVAETRRVGYIYFTTDQKEKLSLTENEITYTTEKDYQGWDFFRELVQKVLKIIQPTMDNVTIRRSSIRFINQFSLQEFNDPSEYFKTQIVSTAKGDTLPFPLIKYGFKLTFDVEDDIYSIVNQSVDPLPDKFVYIFDIDVLNRTNMLFDLDSISEVMEKLREVKNAIFFGNLTNKILELCN